MKADPLSQQTLLELQHHDSVLSQLTHRKKSLPEHDRLAELAGGRKELDGRRIEAETEVSDLTRDQKRADAEVEQVRSRRTNNQRRMDAGQITSAKDLENMQHEIVALDRRIGTLEDAELEVMEALEEAQARLEDVRVDIAAADAEETALISSRDEAITAIDAEAAGIVDERAAAAARVPDDLLALYEKVRAHQGGTGAAALRQRRCEGCRLELNGADLREIKTIPDDEVVRCPECDRILVRTIESGL
ncbi:zinc ribbon domain-containing protein [Solicola sp. PLA-1-18]|uniref:zinc ribbon domain-containing protein n=1 Tax=Solicola sp. PLA-1-18 TaxID=3380532 RepID=UPI003B7CE35F